MKLKCIVSIILLFFTLVVPAQELGGTQADRTAINWMKLTFNQDLKKENILNVSGEFYNDSLVYYHVQFKKGGFVLVSATDHVQYLIYWKVFTFAEVNNQ